MSGDGSTDWNWTGLKFPLAGDVAQLFNPMEFYFRSLSSQMGVINIHNLNTRNAAVEQEIVENVASYGRQLGRINDVLGLLVDRLNDAGLTDTERAAVKDFREMTARIALVKRGWQSPSGMLVALDVLLEGLEGLKEESPQDYEKAMNRIRTAVAPRAITGPKKAAAKT